MIEAMRSIDLTPAQLKVISGLLKQFIPETEVWAYGSRVKWTSTPQSDLDLVTFATPEQERSISNLKEAFEKSNLPFRVDLFIWNEVPETFHKNIEADRVVLQHAAEKRAMGSEWKECTIGDALTLQRGFDITKKEQIDGSVPVVSSGGTKSFHSHAKVKAPGVVLGRKGTLGTVFFLNEDFWPHDTTLWVKDFKGNSAHFIYYFFQNISNVLQSLDAGTSNPALNRNHVHPVEMRLPPLSEQKAIAHILGSLDDKIELNRRMNATLEGMAQALFKSWFVDFDPVIDNALAAGHPIPEELAARAEVRRKALAADGEANREAAKQFPAAFQLTEEMGWIPEGWEISKLKDCTSKIGSGSTPRGGSSAYINDGTRLVRSQNIHDSSFRWDGIVCITDEAADKLKGVTLTKRDVLINITGDSILRTCVVDPSVLPARVNQHVAIIRPKDHLPKHYLHQYIVRSEYKTYLLGFDAGGSRKAVTKGHLEEANILLPHDDILSDFSNIVDPFFDRKNENELQARNLTNLRDTLLPKLISGEIRIPDAEQLTEDALA